MDQSWGFASSRGYWKFASSVRSEARYLHTDETRAFLQAVSLTSESRCIHLEEGSSFWRAQVGHEWTRVDDFTDDEMPSPYSPARMKPLAGRASDGRANPRGIPYLYMANSMITAISEVRPWIGSLVSVGEFAITRSLRIVDCSVNTERRFSFGQECRPEERQKAVWADIDLAFSEPMTRADDFADYVPTQVLAELFKRKGLDGLVYRSSFGGGKNIVLFNPECAQLRRCLLQEVTGVDLAVRDSSLGYGEYAVQPGEH